MSIWIGQPGSLSAIFEQAWIGNYLTYPTPYTRESEEQTPKREKKDRDTLSVGNVSAIIITILRAYCNNIGISKWNLVTRSTHRESPLQMHIGWCIETQSTRIWNDTTRILTTGRESRTFMTRCQKSIIIMSYNVIKMAIQI